MFKHHPQKNGVIFLIAFFALTGISFKADAAANENIGFFENEKLQEMIQKPYYLYNLNKDTAIPFYPQDYIEWQYFIIEDLTHTSEIENPFLCYPENESYIFCNITKTFKDRVHGKKVTNVFIDEDKTKKYLASLSEVVNSEPKNGKIGINEEGEFYFIEDGKVGHELDVDNSYNKIVDIFKNKESDYYIPLVTAKIKPELSKNNFDKLGIKEKIGTGESNFRGSTKNRKFNIKVATSRFHGL
jgi:hypothetical protein